MIVEVIPIIMAELGIPPRKLKERLGRVGTDTKIVDSENCHHLFYDERPKSSCVVSLVNMNFVECFMLKIVFSVNYLLKFKNKPCLRIYQVLVQVHSIFS